MICVIELDSNARIRVSFVLNASIDRNAPELDAYMVKSQLGISKHKCSERFVSVFKRIQQHCISSAVLLFRSSSDSQVFVKATRCKHANLMAKNACSILKIRVDL